MERKKKPVFLYGAIAAAVVVVAVVITVISTTAGSGRKLEKQLNLARVYLEELQYDQAIAAFEKALELDPNSVEAYLGLADAYVGKGEIQAALEILEQGYALTGDERLAERRAYLMVLGQTAAMDDEPEEEEVPAEEVSPEYEFGPELSAEQITFFETVWDLMDRSDYEQLNRFLSEQRDFLASTFYYHLISDEFRERSDISPTRLSCGYYAFDRITYGYAEGRLINCHDVSIKKVLLFDFVEYNEYSVSAAVYLGGISNDLPEGEAHRFKRDCFAADDWKSRAYAYIETSFHEGRVDGDFSFEDNQDLVRIGTVFCRKITGHADQGILNGACYIREDSFEPAREGFRSHDYTSNAELSFSFSNGKVVLDDSWVKQGDLYWSGTEYIRHGDDPTIEIPNSAFRLDMLEEMLGEHGMITGACNSMLDCGLFYQK